MDGASMPPLPQEIKKRTSNSNSIFKGCFFWGGERDFDCFGGEK